MKTAFVICISIVLVLDLSVAPVRAGKPEAITSASIPAHVVPATQPVVHGGELAALEQKLLGTWWGGPCVGNYTLHANGTYELRKFSPGNNTLTGTWSLRWDSLPPTLVVTCKNSDFKATRP